MLSSIFNLLSEADDFLWGYVCVPLILLAGLYFTTAYLFPQIKILFQAASSFFGLLKTAHSADKRGSHPLHAFFASIGGCIGVGNIVAVCTAIQIGGPGALFWMWVAALLGMLIKYAEVYLGIKFRVVNEKGGYDGGPMYFLQKAFRSQLLPIICCVLLVIYGTEIYIFSVVSHSVATNWHVNHTLVVGILLVMVLFIGTGGIERVGRVCSAIIPFFIVVFSSMVLWILYQNAGTIMDAFSLVFASAFSGHSALGGFAGSTVLLAMSQGMARGCYTGDIGVGYASIMHAETSIEEPREQARLAILGIFLDTFVVCTLSVLLILCTGVWSSSLPASEMVQTVLSQYFPYMHIFMPIFITILGYSTIISFFYAGRKCATYLSPRYGSTLYYIFASTCFVFFSYTTQYQAMLVMSLSGASLLVINTLGIFKLRKEIAF